MFASPLSSVRDPVKSFCLCVKVRMEGSGFFFFFLSAQKATGVSRRCFIAHLASSFDIQSLTHIPPLWLWRCNKTSARHLILIPKSYGQDVTRFVG